MIISNGIVTKKLVLDPPAQPYVDLEQTIWPTLDEEDNYAMCHHDKALFIVE